MRFLVIPNLLLLVPTAISQIPDLSCVGPELSLDGEQECSSLDLDDLDDVTTRNSLVLYAKGTHDVSISFSSDPNNDQDEARAVYIGGYTNTKWCIASTPRCGLVGYGFQCHHTPYDPIGLRSTQYQPYWMSWTATSLTAGTGLQVGVNQKAYYDFGVSMNIRALWFNGYDAPYTVRFVDARYCSTTEAITTTTTATTTTATTTTTTTPTTTATTTTTPTTTTTTTTTTPTTTATTVTTPTTTVTEVTTETPTTTAPPPSTSEAGVEVVTSTISPTTTTTTTPTPPPPPPTTTLSTSATTTTILTPPTYSREQKLCNCAQIITGNINDSSSSSAAYEQAKLKAQAAIVKELTVPRGNLSATTRRKVSAKDDRDSSTTLGVFGAVCCFMPLVLIVLADLGNLIRHLAPARWTGKDT